MKKVIFVFALCFLCFTQCKKSNNQINITLYNQSLPAIKSYIVGKWKLNYDIGGISGNIKHEYTNSFIEFKFQPKDSIIKIVNETTEIKSSIEWLRDRDIFTGDTINLIGFNFYQTGLPFSYRVTEIRNDSLVLTDPVADGYSYIFTRP